VTFGSVHSRGQAERATTAGWGGQVRRGAGVGTQDSRHRCLPHPSCQAAGGRTGLDGAGVDVHDAPARGLCSCSCCAGRSVDREQQRRDVKKLGATVEGESRLAQRARRGQEVLALLRGDANADDGRGEVEMPSLRAGSRPQSDPSCSPPRRRRWWCTLPRPHWRSRRSIPLQSRRCRRNCQCGCRLGYRGPCRGDLV
jgi:hypothetical protein